MSKEIVFENEVLIPVEYVSEEDIRTMACETRLEFRSEAEAAIDEEEN